MKHKVIATAVLIVFWLLPPTSPIATADGGGTTPKCAQTEYRQDHLQECNNQSGPAFGVGGGGGSGRGLIGGILKRVPGIGGLF